MSRIDGFIADLTQQGVTLWVEGDHLCYRAPKGAITPSLYQQLAQRKSEIMEALREREARQGGGIVPLLRRIATNRNDFPQSYGQQRLWFLDQFEPGEPLYNIAALLRLHGALKAEVLEQSVREIIQRHESLRTTFATLDGQPVQTVTSTVSFSPLKIDLTALSPGEQETRVQQEARAEATRSFDLQRGPLIRARLLKLAPQEHILLVCMHHIVSDDWSTAVFLRELATLYTAFSQGRTSPLPELPIQYADYALWQRQWLSGEFLEQQLRYWKQQLANAPEMLKLPTDRPRPAERRLTGATHPFTLSRRITQKLQALSQREGVTLYMTLLAGFQIFLNRYSGQEDLMVGTPIANRTRIETEPLIGFFVNTLVLRTRVTPHLSVHELLQRVRKVCLEAYAHQDLPFERLVEELQPERNLSHTPLFQVFFSFRSLSPTSIELPGVHLQAEEIPTYRSKFDLSLYVSKEENTLSALFEYSTDLFEEATTRRLAVHLQRILEGLANAGAQQQLRHLPLLTEREREQLLVGWNQTQASYPEEQCIHQLFEAQARQTPDRVIVLSQDLCLTYAHLNMRANQLAHTLQRLGVGPEVRVGLCLERSPEVVIGLLGILKAGGAYVPLDPSYPQERLAFMLNDSQVSVLVSKQYLSERWGGYQGHCICLDRDREHLYRQGGEEVDSKVTASNLAYVIYTSGSTGRPKGVMAVHRGTINRLSWMWKVYPFASQEVCCQRTSLTFVDSVWEFWGPLLQGVPIFIISDEAMYDPEQLDRLVSAFNVTRIVIVPSLLKALLEGNPGHDPILPSVQLLTSSGEALSRELARWSHAHTQHARLLNLYGSSEVSADATWYDIGLEQEGSQPVPIGRPIANTQAYVLDEYLEPVPIGVAGELYIGGVGLARGYLNHPELTAERFLPHPFSSEPGARFYKTGDVVRYRSDGNLEFLGRRDQQVKIRGIRIEPGEIEAVLRGYPGIQDCVVVAHEDGRGNKRLAAYLVSDIRDNVPLSLAELRAFLQERLPAYLLPASYIELTALPLTSNGKVDRRALPPPEGNQIASEATYVAPRTPIEELLAHLWEQTLGLERVGVHDNFFGLGGDSILSLQLVALARQVGLQLTPRQLFLYQTIAALAPTVQAALPSLVEQTMVVGPVQSTPIQHWFFAQQLATPQHWNQALLLELRQTLDPVLLKQAVEELMRHHDALRLRFRYEATGWHQFSAGHEGLMRSGEGVDVFEHVKLSITHEHARHKVLEAHAASAQTSLDLERGPLIRVILFDFGSAASGYLLMVIHHLAVDDISWRILLDDLQTAYGQLAQGQAVRLLPQTTSFQDWAKLLCEYAQTERLQQECPYWLAQYRGGRIPLDYANGDVTVNTEASAQTITVALNPNETRALLEEVPRAYHTQIREELLAALLETFAWWTGDPRLSIDLEEDHREERIAGTDPSRTVGWFTSLFPVSLRMQRGASPGETLKAVKEQVRQVPRHGSGYGILRYLAPPTESVQRLRALPPRAQVRFCYRGQPDLVCTPGSLWALAGEPCGPMRDPCSQRSYLLDIAGVIREGTLQLEWVYSSHLHTTTTITRLAGYCLERLRALIAHCQSPRAGGFTPSDFPFARLNQEQLNKIVERTREQERQR